jgi:uncharacterized protein YoxC
MKPAELLTSCCLNKRRHKKEKRCIMKTISIIVVAVVILGLVGVFVVPNLFAHIGAKGETIANMLDRNASLEELIIIAKNGVEESRGRIREYHVNVSKGEIKANLIAEEVEELKETRASNEAILKKAKSALANSQRGDTITVNNKTHTWEQVNQDALIRINRCKSLKTVIKEKQTLLEGLSGEIEDAKAQLVDATGKVNELLGKIQEWEAKIAAKRVEVEVSEMVKAINGDPLGSASGVTRAMNALQDRYLELDSKIRVDRDTAAHDEDGKTVDWESELGPRDATEAIDNYFGVGEPEVKEPVTNETEEPVTTDTKETSGTEPVAEEPEPDATTTEATEPEPTATEPDAAEVAIEEEVVELVPID